MRNFNRLANRKPEVEQFLIMNFIETLLELRTHLTNRSYFFIIRFDVASANHPPNRALAGAAVIIRSCVQYDSLEAIQELLIQAADVRVKCDGLETAIYSPYCPPKHAISYKGYMAFFRVLVPDLSRVVIIIPSTHDSNDHVFQRAGKLLKSSTCGNIPKRDANRGICCSFG